MVVINVPTIDQCKRIPQAAIDQVVQQDYNRRGLIDYIVPPKPVPWTVRQDRLDDGQSRAVN